MKDSYQLTQAGIDELKSELEELKGKRGELAEAIRTAKDQGDLKENSEYHDAKDKQGLLESRIQEIEYILNNVEVINTNDNDSSSVQLGDTVTLNGSDGKVVSYTIVGSVEADPTERKISSESPIGKALLGAKKGEKVCIKLPAGEREYTVKKIS